MLDQVKRKRALDELVTGLRDAAGDRVRAIVAYGAEAHGEHFEAARDVYLLIVLRDLELDTLRLTREPVARWLKLGQPMPRFFSPEVIADAADVFPIELLDLAAHHKVLYGENPFSAVDVDGAHLRMQCERELREKLMRLEEAYVEMRGRDKDLAKLMAESYLAFVDIFRGCLRLHGDGVPARAAEVVAQFCRRAELDAAPFETAERLAHGASAPGDMEKVFARYHAQIAGAVRAVDRFGVPSEVKP